MASILAMRILGPVLIRSGVEMSKTFSFMILHMAVACAVGVALTGSWLVGGTLALVEPLCNTVAYHFHERFWARRQRRMADLAA